MKQLGIALFVCSFILTACSQSNKSMAEPDYIVNKKDTVIKSISEYVEGKGYEKYSVATLAGGCFWCTEAFFQNLKGVKKAESGYSGGHVQDPTYRQVCYGNTGHAEVVRVVFDDEVISFDELLEVFWKTHDPTTLNRQGNDVGTQYRSVVFYHDENQRKKAVKYKEKLDASGAWVDPIVTEISPLINYFPAEDYHKDYFDRNGHEPYCSFVIAPKVAKFKEAFKDKLV